MPTNDEVQAALDEIERVTGDMEAYMASCPNANIDYMRGEIKKYETMRAALQAQQPAGDGNAINDLIKTGEHLATLNDENLAAQVVATNNVQNFISESLTALRQMRVEPCGFCEEEKIKWPHNTSGFFISRSPFRGPVLYSVQDELCDSRQINFCPNCGRRLGEVTNGKT